jgi:hypothetical protein
MKTWNVPAANGNHEIWIPLPATARCLHCSPDVMRKWGRSGKFGFKQIGPKKFLVQAKEVLSFYTEKYPNIEIDRDMINSLMQSTA